MIVSVCFFVISAARALAKEHTAVFESESASVAKRLGKGVGHLFVEVNKLSAIPAFKMKVGFTFGESDILIRAMSGLSV